MKLSAIHDSAPPCSEAALRDFESRVGAKLPIEYRQFLLIKNGGFIHHPYTDPESGASFETIFGLQTGFSDFDLIWNFDNSGHGLPNQFLPIGSDGLGNELCLSLDGDCRGSLFFFDHEDPSLVFDEASRLAESFNGFIERLQLADEEPDVELNGVEQPIAEAFRAIYKDNVLLLTQPLANGLDPNSTDAEGYSLLCYAAVECRLECVRLLVERGAEVNVPQQSGDTPLFKAIRQHCSECIRLLVSLGADVNRPSAGGVTPLQEALESQSIHAAGTLMDCGANVTELLPTGHSVEQLIREIYSTDLDAEELRYLLGKLKVNSQRSGNSNSR